MNRENARICPICGSTEIKEKYNKLTCVYCNVVFDIPTNEDIKKMVGLENAESYLRITPPKFDMAEELFSKLISDYPDWYIPYWGYIRAKYGIKYESDEYKKRAVPICYKGLYRDFSKDNYYLKALELCPCDEIKNKYIKEAERIAICYQEYLKKVKDEDYDVFISFKATENDKPTIDQKTMRELYDYLIKKKYKIFFSPVSMNEYVGEPYYDVYIFNAIERSKAMILFGSKEEYFASAWIKNEWNRYLDSIVDLNKKTNSLIIILDGDVDFDNLPNRLKEQRRQGININEHKDWKDIIADKLKNIVGDNEYLIETKNNRAINNLKASKFNEAAKIYQEVLELDPNNKTANYGRLLCYFKARDEKELISRRKRINEADLFNIALNSAKSSGDVEEINKYNHLIEEQDEWIIEHDAKRKKRNLKITLASIIIFFVFVTISLFTLNYAVLLPKNKLDKGRDYINNQDYESAIKVLEGINYEDSPKLLGFAKAGQAFENDQIEEGIDYVYNVGGSIDIIYHDKGKINKDIIAPKRKWTKDGDADLGYNFNGWVINNFNLNIDNYSVSLDLLSEYSLINYKITYHLDGGINNDKNADTYTINDEIILYEPTKKGHTFLGWYDEDDNLVEKINKGTTDDITLYAKYEANAYMISLNPNGGNINVDSINLRYGDNYSLETPTLKGYKFLGWYLNDGLFSASGTYNYDYDVNLIAKYEIINYTITYVLDGGSNDSRNPSTYNINEKVTFCEPHKNGYNFLGWRDGNNNEITAIEEGNIGDIVLFASWEILTYSITYNLNEGENNPLNPATYNVNDEIVLLDAIKTGYTFLNWYDNNSNIIKNIDKGTTGDITLNAKFNDGNLYYVNLNPNGGKIDSDSIEVQYDKQYSLPTPNYVGYRFLGWYLNDDLFPNNGIWNYPNNISLVAHYEERDVDEVIDELIGDDVCGFINELGILRFNFKSFYSSKTTSVVDNIDYSGFDGSTLHVYSKINGIDVKQIIFEGNYYLEDEYGLTCQNPIGDFSICFDDNWKNEVNITFKNFAIYSSKHDSVLDLSNLNTANVNFVGKNYFKSASSNHNSILKANNTVLNGDDSSNLELTVNDALRENALNGINAAYLKINHLNLKAASSSGSNGSDGTSYNVNSQVSSSSNGGNGTNGCRGGDVINADILEINSSNLTLNSGSGGNGGKGGNGEGCGGVNRGAGKGGSGGNGASSGNAFASSRKVTMTDSFININIGAGGAGGNGGNGGNGTCGSNTDGYKISTGGAGGTGGKGGSTGLIFNIDSNAVININNTNFAVDFAQAGNGGNGGDAGSTTNNWFSNISGSVGGNGGNGGDVVLNETYLSALTINNNLVSGAGGNGGYSSGGYISGNQLRSSGSGGNSGKVIVDQQQFINNGASGTVGDHAKGGSGGKSVTVTYVNGVATLV